MTDEIGSMHEFGPGNVNCGGCAGDGTGCNQSNQCVEVVCDDAIDNDNTGGTDCDDSACLNRSCGPGMKRCQADGSCN